MLRDTRRVMGMTAVVAIAEGGARTSDIAAVFDFFTEVDRRFSPFKPESELCRLNRGEVETPSPAMAGILARAQASKHATGGYFDIRRPDGHLDTSGIVKGWAISQGARMLKAKGYRNYAVEIGGDIQTGGVKDYGSDWRVGIRSPFAEDVVKVLYPRGGGVATSGSYHQGAHIYVPHGATAHASPSRAEHAGRGGGRSSACDAKAGGVRPIVSLTVVSEDILDADIAATAAFAMGEKGIYFIERQPGLEGYAIDGAGRAKMTSGLQRYLS